MNKGRVPPVSLYKYFFFHIIPFVNGEGIRMERTRSMKTKWALDQSFLSSHWYRSILLKSHNLKSNTTNIILSLILVNTLEALWTQHHIVRSAVWLLRKNDCCSFVLPTGSYREFQNRDEYKNNSLPKIICHYKWVSVTRIVNTFYY